jgi:hypothetical protein
MKDPRLGFFGDFYLLADLFTRDGFRSFLGMLLGLGVAALLATGAIYLIYGRGPQCVVTLEPEGPGNRTTWWLRTGADLKSLPPENPCSTAAR